MKQLFEEIFKDENGNYSSKRFVGIIGGISLVVYMLIYPSQYSNSSVLIMSLGALGISGIEKINKKKNE
jgi:hypothetical protein